MNPIKNIEIKNFKSIRHIKIEDCRRINVFVGYPNTGKSNILEAIGLYSTALVRDENFTFNQICRVKRFSELFFNKDYRNAGRVVINGQLLLEILINQLNDLELRGHDERAQQELFIATVSSKDFNIHHSARNPQIGLNGIVDPIRKYEFYNNIDIKQQKPFALSVPFGRNLLDILHRDSRLRKEIAALFEDYNLKLVIDDEEILFLKYLTDDTGVSIPYHLVADTLRRLIFYKAAIMSNSDSVLLFEEPESHMFPPYISKFTSDIWYYKDNQYFITTHSPFVINDFLENMKNELAIYAVEYKKDIGETIVKRLTEDQVHEAYQYGIDIFFNLESITK
ncbi:MAG TPA: AAA family ATPase [Puia sp.]|jgi:AAA15 family ATPase/GTPase|nr:AAA family ATPase [Puia sp.]